MTYELHLGDCLEVLMLMPDNSVDSIVTDPPYELSNDGKQSPARVFLEFAFPQNAKIEAKCSSGDCLSVLVDEVLGLRDIRRVPSPPATVPVVTVALNSDAPLGEHNVEYDPKSAVCVSENTPVGDVEPHQTKHLGCFLLKLADRAKTLQVLNDIGSSFVSGGVGVGFRVLPAGFPSTQHHTSSVVGADECVGLYDRALTDLIGAIIGTASDPVFSLDLRRGAIENFSANGARMFASVLLLSGAELVRADAATSCLPAMFEPRRVCVVDDFAHRAFTFDLIVHEQIISSTGFMGKHWDGTKVAFNVDVWAECLRVLKPGGHLLSFSGTRTQHRMVVAIEDAGFEVRDMIAWVYGSGFPKSLDVSKAIDKALGVEGGKGAVSGKSGSKRNSMAGDFAGGEYHEYLPAADAAKQWQGWGTALKPALEPITVARKPLACKTVAANVLTHGTGGINIDACRVPLQGDADAAAFENNHRVTERLPQEYDGQDLGLHDGGWKQRVGEAVIPTGRWPANIIHDGSEEVECAVTSAARFFYSAKASRKDRHEGLDNPGPQFKHGDTLRKVENVEKSGNNHPTVKPTDLMRYLCRLVTPAGGTVLDPFMGSGSTGKAAMLEGFRFIGIEQDAEYLDISRARIEHVAGEDLV